MPKATVYEDSAPAKTRLDEDGKRRKDVIAVENWVWNPDPGVLDWERATQSAGGGGGGGAVTIADGADIAEGAKADAAWSGSGDGTVIALLKGIFGKFGFTQLGTAGEGWAGGSGAAVGTFPFWEDPTLNAGSGGKARARGDATNGLDVDVTRLPALPAGANAIGSVAQGAGGGAAGYWTIRGSDGAAVYNLAKDSTLTDGSQKTQLYDGAAVYTGAKTGQLPAALVGGRVDVNVGASAQIDVSDRAARLAGVVSGGANVFHIDDNAGSVTVDAPVATPVFARLSDGAAVLIGQKVMASSLPVALASDQSVLHVDDNAGSITVDSPVGTPVFTRLSDGAAALIGQKAMAASLPVALASDQSNVPTQERSSSLIVTATAAAAAAATATLAAVASQFHYISAIEITMYCTVARTGAATPIIVTSTNLPGNPAWTFDTAQAVGTEITKFFNFSQPLKSSVVNTATTIVGPATASVIWRINVYYYTAA